MASPSGRAWEVSTKRVLLPTWLRTSASIRFLLLLFFLISLLDAGQEFVDSLRNLLGTIECPEKIRCGAKTEILLELVLYVAGSGAQAFHSLLSFFFCTRDGDKDAHGLASLIEDEVGDGTKPDAGIGQFARQYGTELFAESFRQPLPMMFLSSRLHGPASSLPELRSRGKLFNVHQEVACSQLSARRGDWWLVAGNC